jgi:hypothetical protein
MCLVNLVLRLSKKLCNIIAKIDNFLVIKELCKEE